MSRNGADHHLESFEDVEEEFRAVRQEQVNGQLELVEAIGRLAREVSDTRREVGEVKRVMVESGAQFPRSTDDTGSHDLRATYAKLKASAENPDSPLKPSDVRKIVKDFTEEMDLQADAGTWRWIKAQIRKYAVKAFWLAVAAGMGGVGHWLAGRH